MISIVQKGKQMMGKGTMVKLTKQEEKSAKITALKVRSSGLVHRTNGEPRSWCSYFLCSYHRLCSSGFVPDQRGRVERFYRRLGGLELNQICALL